MEGPDGQATSVHVRRARSGDRESAAWLVERFTPLLLAQAEYRLGPRLRRLCEPADLVGEVWSTVLRRLPELEIERGRPAPAFVRFLGTTLLNHFRNLLKRDLRRGEREGPEPDALAVDVSGVVTRATRREGRGRVAAAIAALSERDREVIVLRGIEQVSAQEAARRLGIEPNTLTVRYRRALGRLRAELGESVLDELPEG